MKHEALFRKLERWAAGQTLVWELVVFGSYARGDERPGSDLDLAVDVGGDDDVLIGKNSAWRTELSKKTGGLKIDTIYHSTDSVVCSGKYKSIYRAASAIGLFNSGASFFEAAAFIDDATDRKEVDLKFAMPFYHLATHAIELTLKAYLRAKGATMEKLRFDLGHDLEKLWQKCKSKGLTLDSDLVKVIRRLAQAVEKNEFRYIRTGGYIRPTPKIVRVLGMALQQAIRHDAYSAPDPHSGGRSTAAA